MAVSRGLYFDNVGLDVDTAALRETYPEVGWHTFEQWLAGSDWPQVAEPLRK